MESEESIETNEETTIETTEPAPPPVEQSDEQADEDAIEGEVVISIGDKTPEPEPEEKDPKLVNRLRKLLREAERKARDAERRLQVTQVPSESKPPELGAKPKLEDHDYDAEKFETALATWFERKRLVDERAAKAKQAEEAQAQAWQGKLNAYSQAKASLRVRDYEESEAAVVETLDVTQQGIIVSGADNPAIVTYALGKDPAKLKELAAIKDPVKFSFAVAKLETQLKVAPKAKPPTPEQTPKGAAPKSNAIDSTLERLREEAQRTGNADRLLAYKRQLKSASK